jgi:enoyl-CoA hydratase/carnithine racemase
MGYATDCNALRHEPTTTDMTPNAATPPLLTVDGGVATITLNRPAHRNRLEDNDLHTLLGYFDQLNSDPTVRVVVVTANTAGQPRPVFCAGYHIGGFESDANAAQFFEKVPDALANLRPITVCALNGSVYGGATDLFLACDLRVALDGVELRMPATALGLHYYPTGLQRYVSRLGPAAARRAFLTARPFNTQQLWQTGCLEAVCPPNVFDASVHALVQDILALAPLALQTTKQSLNDISTGVWDVSRLRERENLTAQSQDFAEGRRAFAERRAPKFTGQ